MSAEPSTQLLHRWQCHRDPDAFAEIVSRYGGLVYSTCLRVVRDAAMAEDATQECFFDLLHTDAAVRSVPGWLHTTATRRALDRVKAERRRLDRESRYAAEQKVTMEPTWDDISIYLDEAIEALPDKLRRPITLRFLQGRAYAEISTELGVPVSTVQHRLKKGIDQIREHLAARGVVAGAAALTALLAAAPGHALPSSIAGYLGKLALAGQGTAPVVAAGIPVVASIKGTIPMNKLAVAAVLVTAATTAWVVAERKPVAIVEEEISATPAIDANVDEDTTLVDDALLDYVQIKQQHARSLLDNYARHYEVTIQSDERLNGMHSTQTRRLAVREYKDGQRLRLEVEEDRQGTNWGAVPAGVTHGDYRSLTQSYTVVNENEAACWRSENGEISTNLTIWRHNSPAKMQRSAAGNVELGRGIDSLDFVFGLENSFGNELPGDIASAREQLAGLGIFRTTRVERDGAQLIEISHEIDGRIWLTAIVDPGRGYATTSIVTSAYPDGAENVQRFSSSISMEQVAEGVWAPVKMNLSQQYTRSETGSQANATVSYVVKNQALNQHFEPAFFQWKTTYYPGDDAFLYDRAGVSHVVKVKDAELQFAPLTNESRLSPNAQAKILQNE